jgi:hypothetical protein
MEQAAERGRLIHAIGRAAAAAILGALVGAAWAALFYAWRPAFTIEFDRDLPHNVSGVYGVERDNATGLTFAWMGDDAMVRLPGLDRRVDWTLRLRLRGGRTLPAVNPTITILTDGVPVTTRPTGAEFMDIEVLVPKRPERRGLALGLRCSATFVPGPGDPRRLGVMLDRLSMTPSGIPLVPRPALDGAALSSAAMGAAIALLGVTPGSAMGAAVLLGATDAAVMTRNFGPFTDYPSVVAALAAWIAVLMIALSILVHSLRRQPLRNTARFAAAFTTSALFLKLLVLLHPNMTVGDTMFHAHKLQGVLAGNLYFTSVAPGGYTFPYPPGLYVFASMFAGIVRRGAGDMALLRIVCTSADAVAGLLLYPLIVRNWGNRLAGATAVAMFHLMPLSFGVLATGNMSNSFAQSAAVAALVVMAWPFTARGRWPGATLLVAAFLVAFLSHTGTLATLFASAVLIAALYLLCGGPAEGKAGLVIAIAAAAAASLAVVVYYGHFMPTYRTEFARIGHEMATGARDAGGRTVGDRLRLVPYSLGIYIGVPVLLFACLGALVRLLQNTADRLTLALGGWLLACLLFLALGVLTPVDMRYYLASLPAVAIVAGSGAAWAWNQGGPTRRSLWRVTTAALLASTISTAFHAWWNALG